MIFKTKKQFEEEVFKRINEVNFHETTERKLYELQDKVRELEFRVRCLEDKDRCEKMANTGCVPVAKEGY